MPSLRSTAGAWIDLCFGDSAASYDGLIQLHDGDSEVLADAIKKSGMGIGDETSRAATELVRNYNNVFRVLTSFTLFEGAWESDLGVGGNIATNLFSVPHATPCPDPTILLSDSHIHGGLAFDPWSLHHLLISRPVPLAVRGKMSKSPDSNGDHPNIPLALAVLRWSSWLFASLALHDPWTVPEWIAHATPSQTFWRWVSAGEFWTYAENACFPNPTSVHCSKDTFDLLIQIDMTRPKAIPDSTLSDSLKQCVHAEPAWFADPCSWERKFLTGLIRFSVATYGRCVARPRDALEVFIDRTSAAKQIKDVILSARRKQDQSENRTEALASALDHMQKSYRSPYGFIGCELRQNIHEGVGDAGPRLITTVITEIRDAILPAWKAAQTYLKSSDSPSSILFSTPLAMQRLPCLERGSQHPQTHTNWQPGQEFEEAIITLEAVRQLEQTLGCEIFYRTIGSLDVSGLETWSSNWPYTSAINWLNTQLERPLSFTIHAGESFAYRMRGLRMIGETFLGEYKPARIGHALALDSTIAKHIESSHDSMLTPSRELISDLCWLHSHHYQKIDQCIDLLYRLTSPMDPEVYRIDPEKWVAGFMLLHSGDLVTKIRRPVDEPASTVLADRNLWQRNDSAWKDDKELFDVCYAFSWDDYPPVRAKSCPMHDPPSPDDSQTVLDYLDTCTSEAESYVREVLHDNKTIIEACPTSNLRLAGVPQAYDHPIWSWIDQNIPVSVNSDDPLVFLHYGGDEVSFLDSTARPQDKKHLQTTLANLQNRGHCQSQMVNLQDVTDMIDALESAFARLL